MYILSMHYMYIYVYMYYLCICNTCLISASQAFYMHLHVVHILLHVIYMLLHIVSNYAITWHTYAVNSIYIRIYLNFLYTYYLQCVSIYYICCKLVISMLPLVLYMLSWDFVFNLKPDTPYKRLSLHQQCHSRAS